MPRPTESTKRRTTISIDKNILNQFKDYCQKMGMKLSPKIELFMASELKKYENQKKRDKK